MFFFPTIRKSQSEFFKGLTVGSSIALGYFPVALTFGFIAEATGLSLIETIAMSIFVFAGAAQYMALNMIAIGTGALEIIFTTFIINIRHLLMSTAISEKAEEDHPIFKAIYAFGITDEVFAVTATKEGKLTSGYIAGVASIAYASWVINSGLGYVLGTSLPQALQQSMSVALYALFIALLIPSLKKHRKVLWLALFAAALNSILTIFLSTGWAIIIATITSAIIIETIFEKKPNLYTQKELEKKKEND